MYLSELKSLLENLDLNLEGIFSGSIPFTRDDQNDFMDKFHQYCNYFSKNDYHQLLVIIETHKLSIHEKINSDFFVSLPKYNELKPFFNLFHMVANSVMYQQVPSL